MRARKGFGVATAAVGIALAVSSIAGARTAIPTSIFFDGAFGTATPNVLNFTGHVKSPKSKCRNHRKLLFAKRPFPSNASFTPVGSTSTDGNASWEKELNVTGSPEFRVRAPVKRFGRPGHRKKCARGTIFIQPKA